MATQKIQRFLPTITKYIQYLFLSLVTLTHAVAFTYEDPSDYPLMGDWVGEWIQPKKGHEKAHPAIAAKLLPVIGGKYKVVILPELYNRTEPYLTTEVPGTHQRVVVKQGDWDVIFVGSEIRGQARLHGDITAFALKKVNIDAPSRGLKPPSGATVLFDGSNYDAWQHNNGNPVTWDTVDDAMQVVTMHNKENRAKGLGGDIRTKESFGSMRLHVEFRYPVEANTFGQHRGNSGLFLHGIGEIQILNSYNTPNYWNECGSIYKRIPAKLDAAGPPLEWQTYDVELEMPENGSDKAYLTVLLNGRILHNKMELRTAAKKVSIGLQDHVNIIQFRNIWLVEKSNPTTSTNAAPSNTKP